MVPGSFECGLAVLAAITTLAPSLAALIAMAFPIPLLAPVMNIVRPARALQCKEYNLQTCIYTMQVYHALNMYAGLLLNLTAHA